jgi:hypothetical protein
MNFSDTFSFCIGLHRGGAFSSFKFCHHFNIPPEKVQETQERLELNQVLVYAGGGILLANSINAIKNTADIALEIGK